MSPSGAYDTNEIEKEAAVARRLPQAIPAGTFRPHVASLPSLPEAHRTIPFRSGASWFRKIAGLCRPGLSRRRRLHGPRQLGHGHSRRRQVWLHAAERRRGQQPDGDVSASALREAGHRHRAATWPRPAATITPAAPRWCCGCSAKLPLPRAISPKSSARPSR